MTAGADTDLENAQYLTRSNQFVRGVHPFSPPGEIVDSSLNKSLRPGKEEVEIYTWVPFLADYQKRTKSNPEVGLGYWLAVPEDDTEIYMKFSVPDSFTVTLYGVGWHMIGSPFPIYWGEVEVYRERVEELTGNNGYAGPLEPYIFKYDEGYLVNIPPDWTGVKLEPAEVYWIKTTRDKVSLRFRRQDLQNVNGDNSADPAGGLWNDAEEVDISVPPGPPSIEVNVGDASEN